MANCTYCGKQFGFLEYTSPMKRCKNCEASLHQTQSQLFYILDQEFQKTGIASSKEQDLIQHLAQQRIPQDIGMPILQKQLYYRGLSEIMWGNIPVIRTRMILDSDETAHFSISAVYHKPNKKIKYIDGTLTGTNKKCYFVSFTGSDNFTMDWNNISQTRQTTVSSLMYNKARKPVIVEKPAIHISVTKGSGGGNYEVQDPLYIKIFIDTLAKLWKRQLVIYQEQKAHGAIPQHIRAAVFKRDGGRCVQCGYDGEYIEYDHIMPRSKGGQNTVDNVQLLCRKCNLKKGDRV